MITIIDKKVIKKISLFIIKQIMTNYDKTSHFSDWLENTKDIEPQKYTEEQFNADLKKWVQNEKYSQGQMNSIEKYFLQEWIQKLSSEISEFE